MKPKYKVAIIEGKWATLMPEGPLVEQRVLGADVEISHYGIIRPENYKTALSDLDGVISRPGAPFCQEMISVMRKIKVIVSLGVGYEQIDLESATKRGIPVCNIQDYATQEVAESTIAMLLSHQRKIVSFHYLSQWNWKTFEPIKRSDHLKVGIVGLGKIGTAVAKRLKPFGYEISFYDPYIAQAKGENLGLHRFLNFEELVKNSDIVSFHCPQTKETTAIIDERFFDLVSDSAIVLNTARGRLFKNADIIYEALKKKPHLRIGSDTWPTEPPPDHPLLLALKNREPWLSDRLILTPHASFYSEQALYNLRYISADIVRTVLDGEKPYNVINGAK